jgi:hypothetical protein
MKKLDSIELLHANGDSTIIVKESILDIVIEDITQTWVLEDEFQFDKIYTCSAFHLEILYNQEEDDKEVVEHLLEQRDLVGFIIYYNKKDKVHMFELPYLEVSEEDENNIFELAFELDINELVEDAKEGDKVIALDVSMDNLDLEEDEELE